MKTPIEELIEVLKPVLERNLDWKRFEDNVLSVYLKDEKNAIILAHAHGISFCANHGIKNNASENYYNEIFNP
jgi:hypothetical protein